jgi:mono/diheme cytochrome c family protein
MIEPMLGSWRKRVSMAGVLGLLVPTAVLALSINAMAQSPSPSASGTPSLPGDPVKGEQLYTQNCVSCHGASLEGGIGPRLNPIQKLSGVQDPLDPEYLIATIRDGRPASDGFPKMPPKGGNDKLTDQDIKDLAAYIIKVNREPGGAPLSPAELARSNVFWVSVGIIAMLVITYLLATYNMRWIARRTAARRNR